VAKGFWIAIALMLIAVQPVAADPAAAYVTKIFIDACIANLGQPTKVREWAEQHHLGQIQAPAALGLFVGAGSNGTAWAIPTAQGSIALSIRGTTQACAAWARTADPNEVMTNFKKIVEGTKRPGIEITVDKDTTLPGPVGEIHALVYNVTAPGAPTSFEFTLLTAEPPGGAFQASLQAAKAGPH
jgi:hypothetical protein